MLPALFVIVALKLEQQTTSSSLPVFYRKQTKALKIVVSLKNLNDEMSLDTLLFGSNKYKDTVNKEILVYLTNSLKTTKRFERPLLDSWCYFMTTFFNFSSSFTFPLKIDVETLLAPYQFLQISIFSLFLNSASQVLLWNKHIFLCSTSP